MPKKTTLKSLEALIVKSARSADTKFAALAEDIAAVQKRMDMLDAQINHVKETLGAKIDRLDTKLTKFEENEINKRKQLEVRVTTIERHLGLDKQTAA